MTKQNFETPKYLLGYPKKSLFEGSNLPFDTKTRENIDDQIERISKRQASLVVIDGTMGKGKTTLGVHIANYVNSNHIDFDSQYGMGGKQFMKKIDIATDKKMKVIIYDEAGDFNRRGSLQRFNATLNRFFETYRTFNIMVIVILPSFRVLDKQLMDNGIPRLLLHCTRRTNTYAELKGYSLKRMYYLLDKMKKTSVPNIAYKMQEANFKGRFKDLPKELSDELNRISTEGKKDIMRESRISISGLVNRSSIATHFGKTEMWVGKMLTKGNISPTDKIGRTSYYSKDIIKTFERMQKLSGNKK